MATLAGGNVINLTTPDSPVQPGRVLQSRSLVNPVKDVDRAVDGHGTILVDWIDNVVEPGGAAAKPAAPQDEWLEAHVINETTPGTDWWERIHLLPREGFQFGNIISDATYEIEIFNAFRLTTVEFTSFTNNTGPGISLDPDPTPVDIPRLHSLLLDLLVEAAGSSAFDSTLDFLFDSGVGTLLMPASGSRIVLWSFPPELPFVEDLTFKTDIIGPKDDGSEQRIALRKAPRQTFRQKFFVEEGPERRYAESILFDWQANIFGLPIWHERTLSTAAVLVGDTLVAVQSTEFRDYRVGGQVVIWTGYRTFSVMTIASFTATTITFTAAIGDAFDAGAEVMPVRDQVMTSQRITAVRGRVGYSIISIDFRVVDNDVDLASLTGWTVYNGKVVLDDPNLIGGDTMSDVYERQITVIDGETGVFLNRSTWAKGKRNQRKGFKMRGLEELWIVRGLMHALYGKQVSFYLPSFSDDMEPFTTFSSGGSLMPINNIGYAQFVQARQPKNVIRVTLANGTTLIRTITGATEIDSTREDLTVDVNWPSTIEPEDVVRIEYVHKARFNSDGVQIQHLVGGNDYSISMPVKDVFE